MLRNFSRLVAIFAAAAAAKRSIVILACVVLTQYRIVTDGQTD